MALVKTLFLNIHSESLIYRETGVIYMPRIEYRFSITIKDRKTGDQFTVHLIETLWPGKFWLRYKGKRSEKYKKLTTTRMAQKISQWIVKQQKLILM